MNELLNDLESLTHVPDKVDLRRALERTTHLAIGAHQDDLEIFAYHGIAECFEKQDAWFGGITVTDGGGSARTGPYADYSDEQMKAVRHAEQNAAADIGKYSFQSQLNLPSKTVKNQKECEPWVTTLAKVLKIVRPHTLYLHNPADKHPTHLAVLKLCIAALKELDEGDWPKHVYGCEVWRGLDWIRDEDKIALPVDQHPALAREIVDIFKSQIVGGKSYTEATLGRRRANATYYASHSVDNHNALTFAIDLRPLLEIEGLTPEIFVLQHIDKFCADVRSAYDALKS